MRPLPNSWPDTHYGNGAVFFFQRMREMLLPETQESYRALTLDTLARLSEAREVIGNVQMKRIPAQALEPVYAEVKWSLSKDPVAKLLVGPEIDVIIANLSDNKLSVTDHCRNIVYLQEKLRLSYKTTLEEKICEEFSDPTRRLALRQLSGFYGSHIINLGYSRSYILRILQDEFLASDIQRVRPQLLRRFFGYFDGIPRKMRVVTPVGESCGNLLDRLSYNVVGSVDQLRNPAAVEHYSQSPHKAFWIMRVAAFDEEGAVQQVEHKLGSLRAMALISPSSSKFSWTSERYVIREKSTRGTIVSLPPNTLGRPSVDLRPGGKTIKTLRLYARRLTSSFDAMSTERILGSINTCALARNSSDREVQLISIWSAVEILLSEPDPGVPRIVHYVRHLVPCICARYIRRQLAAAFEQLMVQYKRKFLSVITDETDFVDGDEILRFASVLMLAGNEPLRVRLCSVVRDNPLALNRLAKLHHDFGTPANLSGALSAHSERVDWQLHRIYRARNGLVHAGRVPSFLDSLILNAFEYYSITVDMIKRSVRTGDAQLDIDQAIAKLGIDYAVQMKYVRALKNKLALSPNDVRGLLIHR